MPSIVKFFIAADNPTRARKFYESLFDWKLQAVPRAPDYYSFKTSSSDGASSQVGGLGKRWEPSERITVWFDVASVDAYAEKVTKLGGKAQPKTPVPGLGWTAMCTDTEGNSFGLWQDDKNAK
jgi:predicted enzyme related to lactoylglutathione lyase